MMFVFWWFDRFCWVSDFFAWFDSSKKRSKLFIYLFLIVIWSKISVKQEKSVFHETSFFWNKIDFLVGNFVLLIWECFTEFFSSTTYTTFFSRLKFNAEKFFIFVIKTTKKSFLPSWIIDEIKNEKTNFFLKKKKENLQKFSCHHHSIELIQLFQGKRPKRKEIVC